MNTLFDKIWDAHVVTTVEDGPTQLYIDRLYCHEVTSPQAFAGLRARGIKVFILIVSRRIMVWHTIYFLRTKQLNPACTQSGKSLRTYFTWDDHCLRRFTYFHSRRDGSGCFWYRYK